MRHTLDAPPAQAPAPIVLRGARPRRGSGDHAAARLRAACRYYEQNVIAWYALGRLVEARAARDAIARCRQELDAAAHRQ
jgi:hypothetical protein